MLRAILAVATFSFVGFAASSGCMQHGETNGPTTGPEARCADACRARAPSCTDAQCARGCRVMLDRLVEREQPGLIACVARSSAKSCDETIFAECAARVGPFADGGPPPPKPPSDDDDNP